MKRVRIVGEKAAVSVCAALLIVAAMSPTVALAWGNAKSKCSGMGVFIAARGTGEAGGDGAGQGGRTSNIGGYGRLSDEAGDFATATDTPFWVESLNYPATAFGPDYALSVQQGVTTLRAEINSIVAQCPNGDIVLSGYSQGAEVIGDLLDPRTNTPLSVQARNRIVAVTLMGDPTYRHGEPWDAPGNGTEDGAFASSRSANAFGDLRASVWGPTDAGPHWVSRVRTYCKPRDQWCQNDLYPDSPAVHSSYGVDHALQYEAYSFVRQLLINPA